MSCADAAGGISQANDGRRERTNDWSTRAQFRTSEQAVDAFMDSCTLPTTKCRASIGKIS